MRGKGQVANATTERTRGSVARDGRGQRRRGGAQPAMYSARSARHHIPDVGDEPSRRPIASREPPATSTRDYADAANASEISLGHQREQLLGDVQERVGDFAEWRMDYSRQLAKYAVRPLRCVAPRTAALPPVLCVWRLAQLSCT